jgi:hypothetical protein
MFAWLNESAGPLAFKPAKGLFLRLCRFFLANLNNPTSSQKKTVTTRL